MSGLRFISQEIVTKLSNVNLLDFQTFFYRRVQSSNEYENHEYAFFWRDIFAMKTDIYELGSRMWKCVHKKQQLKIIKL